MSRISLIIAYLLNQMRGKMLRESMKTVSKVRILFKRFVAFALCMVLIFISISIPIEANNETTVPQGCECITENMDIIITILSSWENHYNVEISVRNTSSSVIHDWCLATETDDIVKNLYNAIEISEQTNGDSFLKLFKNNVYNQDILP